MLRPSINDYIQAYRDLERYSEQLRAEGFTNDQVVRLTAPSRLCWRKHVSEGALTDPHLVSQLSVAGIDVVAKGVGDDGRSSQTSSGACC